MNDFFKVIPHYERFVKLSKKQNCSSKPEKQGIRRDMRKINIITHMPTDKKDIEELSKRISQIHVRKITKYIQDLQCSEQDKDRIFQNIL